MTITLFDPRTGKPVTITVPDRPSLQQVIRTEKRAREALRHVLDPANRPVLKASGDQGRFIDASAAVLSRELMRARFELPIQDVIKVVHGGRPCGAPPRRNGDPSTPQLSTKTADPPVTGSLSIAPPVRADVLPSPRHKLKGSPRIGKPPELPATLQRFLRRPSSRLMM